ncbi:hypothetical protein SAMN05880501_11314 [Ureibacillus xyleni]|uniref:Uncharacterized protein n=1 Tax=Ureibacillus xyleni TaxID=614648 RepID=A0A285TM36_9BACL|nr:hypothetical protein [Ureibacillus xyleni]SOC21551.1 hypothetical protein SAMN05880501_11314 [Ureibacillus xyleni]
MDLSGLFDWIKEQAMYILFIGVIIGALVLGFKRAWIQLVGLIIGFGIIGIFIANPNVITDIAEWLGDLTNIGG